MLQELNIKNIALIRDLSISFNNGLNVLSGETGAGKTIIVDSMSLILGERGSKNLIKYGEEKGFVEAMFSTSDAESVKNILEEHGIESDELIVSRELTSSGKNVCRINGRMVSLNVLKMIMSRIINLHGQGQHSEIFEKKHQLEMLDRYGECKNEIESVVTAYNEFSETKKRLSSINTNEQEIQRLTDMLTYQYREIESASLKLNEDNDLISERTIMHNSERISSALNESDSLINGENGVLTKLKSALNLLESISNYNPAYQKFTSSVSEAYYLLEDVSYELSDAIEDTVFDENRLDEIEARLDIINSLKRKYGHTIQDIIDFGNNAKKQLSEINHADELKNELETLLNEKISKLTAACSKLRNSRKIAAAKLEDELIGHLKDLGMKNADFKVKFVDKEPDKTGSDDIEFYITLNIGEPIKPLSKVASGGEASRIMLAIKSIFATKEDVSTLIFDEIDTGISGNMARIVARKLANISNDRQIICVSHLPQLAAMGDENYEIVKSDDDIGTVTTVNKLDENGKLREISRLSGGIQSSVAIAHAKELINECITFKSTNKKLH